MDRIDGMRAFVRVAELGSFSRVARELGVRQSTVTKWVQALEAELGVELLRRTTRSQSLSEAGRSFLEEARYVLESYDAAVGALQRRRSQPTGTLRLSVPVVFGQRFIVPKLPGFLARYPQVKLDLRMSDEYIDLVREGIDVAVRVGVALDSSLRCRRLGQSERWLVAAPTYLERAPSLERPEQLEEHRCLLYSGVDAREFWRFERGRRAHAVSIQASLRANNSQALCALAEAGQGVALLADWLVSAPVLQGKLVRLLRRYRAPVAHVQALLPVARLVPEKSRAFVDYLAQELGPELGLDSNVATSTT